MASKCPLCDEVLTLYVPGRLIQTRQDLVCITRAMYNEHIEDHVNEIESWVNSTHA